MNNTIFELNSEETYSVLEWHNLSDELCNILTTNGFTGANLQRLSEFNNEEDFKEYLDTFFKQKNISYFINEYDLRHFTAIVINAKSNPTITTHFKEYVIFDIVHKEYIRLHPLLGKIINLIEFQRLRYIKQTGILYYVYPSATHTRFEHSIGTSYLAHLVIDHLKKITKKQQASLITEQDSLCIQIAALLHDCGHGPFSHLFEHVVEKLKMKNWKHEIASLAIVERIYNKLKNDFNSYGLFEDDLQFIKDLIHIPNYDNNLAYSQQIRNLESLKKRGIEKSFMFEIVSNKRNGIDVDRWDYIARDCFYIGLGLSDSFDYKRYIEYSKILKCEDGLNQICTRDIGLNNVYQMFHVREQLNRRAYQHDAVGSVEIMVVEALSKADSYFKITDTLKNLNIDEYLKLNDSIYLNILNSDDYRLHESKEILMNVETRNFYKLISATMLTKSDNCNIESIREKLFAHLNEKLNINNNFDMRDICINIFRINYGASKKNPVEDVRFYGKFQANKGFKIEKEKVSSMLLNIFEDVVLRVYYKKSNMENRTLLCKVFRDWCVANNYTEPFKLSYYDE